MVHKSRGLAAAVFILGGAAYLGVELAWRGMTHWTMFFAGGLCLCGLCRLERSGRPLAPMALRATGGVLLVELAFGLFCTRLLGVPVWDYSGEWGNLAGLVCPKYTLLWFPALPVAAGRAARRGGRVASAVGHGDKVPKTRMQFARPRAESPVYNPALSL